MKLSLSKKELFSFVLFFVLVNLLVIWPILLGPYDLKFISFFYLIVGVAIFSLLRIPYSSIRRTRVFFLLIIVNFITLFVHLKDINTVVNICTLVLSYLVLYSVVVGGIKYFDYQGFEGIIFKSILYVLLISLFVSPILTYFKWPYAPPYYPWEALLSSKRLLLVIGKNVGHSDSMWLMAFGAAFFMKKIFYLKQRKLINIFILVLLFWGLVETESRTALLFIIILLFGLVSYLGLFPKRLFVLVPILGTLLFYFSILNPIYQVKVNNLIISIQESFPSLRIASSINNTQSIYSGRNVLNLAFFSVFADHPLFGAGDSNPIFLYGVDSNGKIAYGEDKIGTSETMIRLLAKFGVFYFFVLILFISYPMIRAYKGYYEDNIFVISVCAIILISGLNGSIFENLYGISGLFTILILNFLVTFPYNESKLDGMTLIN